MARTFRNLASERYPPAPEAAVATFNGVDFVRITPASAEPEAVLLLLPGIDGQSASIEVQLSRERLRAGDGPSFAVWRLTIGPQDRSSYASLVDACLRFLKSQSAAGTGGALLAGESFGGLLSLGVAAHCRADADLAPLVRGLVIANPATSFKRSAWPLLGPALSLLPPPAYAVLGGAALYATVPDAYQRDGLAKRTARAIGAGRLGPRGMAAAVSETIGGITERLAPDTLLHRFDRWLFEGSRKVEPALATLEYPTLVITGTSDLLIPSADEGRRLEKILPNAKRVEIFGAGHVCVDDRCNLLQEIRDFAGLGLEDLEGAPFEDEADAADEEPGPPKDPVSDFVRPNATTIEESAKRVRQIRNLTSPVFMSVDPQNDAEVLLGLSGVPDTRGTGRPLLLVGNHQAFGLDLGPILLEYLEDRDLLVRGLAHPAVAGSRGRRAQQKAQQDSEGGDDAADGSPADGADGADGAAEHAKDGDESIRDAFLEGFKERRQRRRGGGGDATGPAFAGGGLQGGGGGNLFETFGAVEVTPRNAYRLLEEGEAVLLFPGGVREVYAGQDEAYKLFWPNTTDFVRLASRFNATIVPFGAVGVADSFKYLLSPEELLEVPVVGDRLKRQVSSVPLPSMNEAGARAAAGDGETADRFNSFVPPFALPKAPGPQRGYVLFGPAIETADLDPRDREACKALYEKVRRNAESNIDYILEMRKSDKYREFLPRKAYEAVAKKPVPAPQLDVVTRGTVE